MIMEEIRAIYRNKTTSLVATVGGFPFSVLRLFRFPVLIPPLMVVWKNFAKSDYRDMPRVFILKTKTVNGMENTEPLKTNSKLCCRRLYAWPLRVHKAK